jgi:hypothetical protein
VAVRRGYKQTPEHIAKRVKRGSDHPHWQGDAVSEKGGRARALRKFKAGLCERCQNGAAEMGA